MNSRQAMVPNIACAALLFCLCMLSVPVHAQLQPGTPAPVASAQSDASGENSRIDRSAKLQSQTLPDFNQDIYFRNKLEFALDGGYFPINMRLKSMAHHLLCLFNPTSRPPSFLVACVLCSRKIL